MATPASPAHVLSFHVPHPTLQKIFIIIITLSLARFLKPTGTLLLLCLSCTQILPVQPKWDQGASPGPTQIHTLQRPISPKCRSLRGRSHDSHLYVPVTQSAVPPSSCCSLHICPGPAMNSFLVWNAARQPTTWLLFISFRTVL